MAETNGTSNGHDAKERAEALKAEGNAHFQAGRNAEAVEKYNEAVELNPEVPAYYTNRAFCHLKMENHGLAIADATVALELDKTFVKDLLEPVKTTITDNVKLNFARCARRPSS